MPQNERPAAEPSSIALRAVVTFGVVALAGLLWGPDDWKVARRSAIVENLVPASTPWQPPPSEQIQQLLASGGCPGWIELAGNAELAQQIDGGDVRQAAAEEPTPQPIENPYYRVTQLAESTGDADSSSAADSDELISEAEDLYVPQSEAAAETEQPAEADSSTPAEEPTAPEKSAEVTEPTAPAELPSPNHSLETSMPQPDPREEPESAGVKEETSGVVDKVKPDASSAPSTEVAKPAAPVTPQPAAPPLPAKSENLAPPSLDKSLFAPPALAPSRPPGNSASAGAASNSSAPASAKAKSPQETERSRCEFIAHSLYPPAASCRTCHEKIYDEWSMSSHAYAAVSPMFHKFEQKINDLAQGTIGYFCYRCHTPAGTNLGISRAAPLYDAPLVAREGVTCVACHRIAEMYGKSNGERRIEPGDIYAPVYGSLGGDGVAAVVAQADKFKVRTSPQQKGPAQDMHAAGLCQPQLSHSEFCMSCHQVAVHPGIKLEVVWEQYRASPACKKGIRCQDCHMGRVPGLPSGFEAAPAALINKKPAFFERRHSNHVFYGPGYSIAHPGVFPFHPKAERWPMRDWLQFDWRAGWGTKEFERAVKSGVVHIQFTAAWQEADDRADAREIVEDNLKKRGLKNQLRKAVMENGSHVDGPYFAATPTAGQDLRFEYVVTNTNEGHNLPTASLGAQPQLWANVALIGPDGRRLWESGYLDRLGDLADIHSEEVRHKRIGFDWQLFNLQTMFMITGAKGTDREFLLPINVDIDPLPFIRPAAQPVSVINHPPFIRMEARSLEPLGGRRATYKIPGKLLCQPGTYRLSFRMRNRTEPLYFMRFCGSTAEMQRAMIEGTLDFHESSVAVEVR